MKQVTLQTPGITQSEATDLRNAEAAYQKAQTALQLAGRQTFNPYAPYLEHKVQPWVLLGTTTCVHTIFEQPQLYKSVHNFFQYYGPGKGHNSDLYYNYVQAKHDLEQAERQCYTLMANGAPFDTRLT